MLAIMGSSGAGKSTLLNIIGILDELDSGDYNLDGIQIKGLSEKKAAQYRNKFLGFVFQSFNLINFKNALENVALPLYYQGLNRKERQKKQCFIFKSRACRLVISPSKWTVWGSETTSGHSKSFSFKSKINISRWANRCFGLNYIPRDNEVSSKIKHEGKTILIVTHEEDISLMCKRIVRLKDGVITEDKKIKQNKL